jgi:hypothetical protein
MIFRSRSSGNRWPEVNHNALLHVFALQPKTALFQQALLFNDLA